MFFICSLTPGVAPLRATRISMQRFFHCIPRTSVWIYTCLAVGCALVTASVTRLEHIAGGACPGPLIDFSFYMLFVFYYYISPGQAPPPIYPKRVPEAATRAHPTGSHVQIHTLVHGIQVKNLCMLIRVALRGATPGALNEIYINMVSPLLSTERWWTPWAEKQTAF